MIAQELPRFGEHDRIVLQALVMTAEDDAQVAWLRGRLGQGECRRPRNLLIAGGVPIAACNPIASRYRTCEREESGPVAPQPLRKCLGSGRTDRHYAIDPLTACGCGQHEEPAERRSAQADLRVATVVK